jgi:UDP-glucose 4-epimerase
VLDAAMGKRTHVEIFGTDYDTPDGTCVRDYIHVCDLADAHVRVLDKLARESCRYNLGNGKGYSVKEVIEMARKVTGEKIDVRLGQRRPGDPPTLVASSDRIRKELGWQPRFADLESIVRTAWEWRRRHHNGYPD